MTLKNWKNYYHLLKTNQLYKMGQWSPYFIPFSNPLHITFLLISTYSIKHTANILQLPINQ